MDTPVTPYDLVIETMEALGAEDPQGVIEEVHTDLLTELMNESVYAPPSWTQRPSPAGSRYGETEEA